MVAPRLECVYLMNVALYIRDPATARAFHIVSRVCFRALHSLHTNLRLQDAALPEDTTLYIPHLRLLLLALSLSDIIDTLECDIKWLRCAADSLFRFKHYRIDAGATLPIDEHNLRRIADRIVIFRGSSADVLPEMTSLRKLCLTDTTQLSAVVQMLPTFRALRYLSVVCPNTELNDVTALVENLSMEVILRVTELGEHVSLGPVKYCAVGTTACGTHIVNTPDSAGFLRFGHRALRDKALKRIVDVYRPERVVFVGAPCTDEEFSFDLSEVTCLSALELNAVSVLQVAPPTLTLLTLRSAMLAPGALAACHHLRSLAILDTPVGFPVPLPTALTALSLSGQNLVHFPTLVGLSQLHRLSLSNCRSTTPVISPTSVSFLEIDACTFQIMPNDECCELVVDTYVALNSLHLPRRLRSLELGGATSLPTMSVHRVHQLRLVDIEHFDSSRLPIAMTSLAICDTLSLPAATSFVGQYLLSLELSVCRAVTALHLPPSLSALHAEACPELLCVIGPLPSLRRISLVDCCSLSGLHGLPDRLEFCLVSNCPQLPPLPDFVNSFPNDTTGLRGFQQLDGVVSTFPSAP